MQTRAWLATANLSGTGCLRYDALDQKATRSGSNVPTVTPFEEERRRYGLEVVISDDLGVSGGGRGSD